MYISNVKYYRELINMHQSTLAVITGLSCGYINHLESGKRKNPSIKTMEKVAKALNRTVEEVFFKQIQ